MKSRQTQRSPSHEAFLAAQQRLYQAPGVGGLVEDAVFLWAKDQPFGRTDWARVRRDGIIAVNPQQKGSEQEWIYVLSHCLLHLAFGHFKPEYQNDPLWTAACDCTVARLLADLDLGTPPLELSWPIPGNVRAEETLYRWLQAHDSPEYHRFSLAGVRGDLDWTPSPAWRKPVDWQGRFAQSLRESVGKAVEQAGAPVQTSPTRHLKAERAKAWFVSSYPLLGAVAAGFTLVADRDLARRLEVPIAAVCPGLGEIYLNPTAQLTQEE